MELRQIKIKKITKTEQKAVVYDISVQKNHNFFIGPNKIMTHNCDYLTHNAQASLRNIMESFSRHTRFIMTCNYVERILPSIISRCTCFHLQTPDKKLVAKRLAYILEQENIQFSPQDLAKVVLLHYPDQRAIINEAQRCSFSGTLVVSELSKNVADYCSKILDELKDFKDIKTTFTNIRQIIADSKVRQFDELFRYLYDNLESFAGQGKQAQTILHIADAAYKSSLVIDKEIIVAAMFINILKDLK